MIIDLEKDTSPVERNRIKKKGKRIKHKFFIKNKRHGRGGYFFKGKKDQDDNLGKVIKINKALARKPTHLELAFQTLNNIANPFKGKKVAQIPSSVQGTVKTVSGTASSIEEILDHHNLAVRVKEGNDAADYFGISIEILDKTAQPSILRTFVYSDAAKIQLELKKYIKASELKKHDLYFIISKDNDVISISLLNKNDLTKSINDPNADLDLFKGTPAELSRQLFFKINNI